MKAFFEKLQSTYSTITDRVKKYLMIFMICFMALSSFYLGCLHYLEPHQVGIAWNWIAGDLSLDDRAGWHLSLPWVKVARIDARPQRVCITSASRAFNCRLVRFNPKKYRDFVKAEGFRYYWFSNRISFNNGYIEEYRGFRDVLRGYAYSAKCFSFITIMKEFKEEP